MNSPPLGIAEIKKLNNLPFILDVCKLSKQNVPFPGDLSLFFNRFQRNAQCAKTLYSAGRQEKRIKKMNAIE